MTTALPTHPSRSSVGSLLALKELQDFCKAKGPKELHAHCGVSAKEIDTCWIFDYDEFATNWDSHLPWICRGLITDAEFNVLAAPMVKFWNAEQGAAAKIDWATAAVFIKLDGSMINRYWYNGEWRYATRYNMGSALSGCRVNGMTTLDWHQLIHQTFGKVAHLIDQPKEETWTFELCSPANRVVVAHPEPFVGLLAIKNNVTLEEREVFGHALACPIYPLQTYEQCKKYADEQPGNQMEGFVVRDGSFQRVKIKGLDYCNLHRMKDGILNTWKNLAGIVRKGGYEAKLLELAPDRLGIAKRMEILYKDEIARTAIAYEKLKSIPIRKDFALAVKNEKLIRPDALFVVYSNRSLSIQDYFEQMDEAGFVRLGEALGFDQLNVDDELSLAQNQMTHT